MNPFLSPQILSQCLLNHEFSHQKAVDAEHRAPPKTGVTIPPLRRWTLLDAPLSAALASGFFIA